MTPRKKMSPAERASMTEAQALAELAAGRPAPLRFLYLLAGRGWYVPDPRAGGSTLRVVVYREAE